MYTGIGVNAKKQLNYVRRRVRMPKLTNRNYYIYSYDGEKALNLIEEDLYNDGLYSDNREEWDEYPEIEDVNEQDFDESYSNDDDEEVWEKYDGNSTEYADNYDENYPDDYEDNEEDEDCQCDFNYGIDITPKKAVLFSAGILVGVLAISYLVKKRR